MHIHSQSAFTEHCRNDISSGIYEYAARTRVAHRVRGDAGSGGGITSVSVTKLVTFISHLDDRR